MGAHLLPRINFALTSSYNLGNQSGHSNFCHHVLVSWKRHGNMQGYIYLVEYCGSFKIIMYNCVFVFFEWMPSQRKEVGIPLGILPHVQEQNKQINSLGQVNPNFAATGNRTQRLARHQAAMRTQTDWNSVCPQRNPGVCSAPGGTLGIMPTILSL